MIKEKVEIIFKTLLSKSEYLRLATKFEGKPSNLQINYYFDTSRFTLKASEIILRVRQREELELTLRRKKGYNKIEINCAITEAELADFIATGVVPSIEIQNELNDILKGQSLVNYMSFKTFRIFFSYGRGNIALDKCDYLGETDYELEYEASNYEQGKRDFIDLIKEYNIVYKKSEAKIKRAYNALKKL